MDSSDDEFTWCNASSDSDSRTSEIMEAKNKSKQINYECESEHQRQLSHDSQKKKHKNKSKKRKYDEVLSEDNDYQPTKKKCVRSGSENDNDEANNHNASLDLSSVSDTSYFNLRIKEENNTFSEMGRSRKKAKHKKKNNKSINELELLNQTENSESIVEEKSKKKKKDKHKTVNESGFCSNSVNDENVALDMEIDVACHSSLPSDNYLDLRVQEENLTLTEIVKTKKKEKHIKENELDNTENSDIKLDISDIDNEVQSSRKKRKKKRRSSGTNDTIDESDQNKPNTYLNSDSKENDSCVSHENEKNIIVSETLNDSSKKSVRVSDLIKFEDHEQHDIPEVTEPNIDILSSSDVNLYLQRNSHLSNMKLFIPFNPENEDVWILKCPSEINISDFQDADLTLDGKSKIKIAGQTYNGTINTNTATKITMVTQTENKRYLRIVPIKEIITFRKRLPKPHVQDETVTTNNPLSFIQLPDTKCRHPLFGTNYKNAIKVPKSAATHLRAYDDQAENVKIKAKYKKEVKKLEKESELENDVSMKDESDSPVKKHKRRHKVKEEDVKPAKRIKLEQGPGAWESEKAIEETLFNF